MKINKIRSATILLTFLSLSSEAFARFGVHGGHLHSSGSTHEKYAWIGLPIVIIVSVSLFYYYVLRKR